MQRYNFTCYFLQQSVCDEILIFGEIKVSCCSFSFYESNRIKCIFCNVFQCFVNCNTREEYRSLVFFVTWIMMNLIFYTYTINCCVVFLLHNIIFFKMSKKTSILWHFFTEVSTEKVKCGTCSLILTSKGGSTSAMRKHLEAKHKDKIQQLKKLQEEAEIKLKSEKINIVLIFWHWWFCKFLNKFRIIFIDNTTKTAREICKQEVKVQATLDDMLKPVKNFTFFNSIEFLWASKKYKCNLYTIFKIQKCREVSGEKVQNISNYFACSSDSDGDKPTEKTNIDQVRIIIFVST